MRKIEKAEQEAEKAATELKQAVKDAQDKAEAGAEVSVMKTAIARLKAAEGEAKMTALELENILQNLL